jgi:hypothetical protein
MNTMSNGENTMTKTAFETKCEILSYFYLYHREEAIYIREHALHEPMMYHTIAFPLAFFLKDGMVKAVEDPELFIEEGWEALLVAYDIDDTGFENTRAFLNAAGLKHLTERGIFDDD